MGPELPTLLIIAACSLWPLVSAPGGRPVAQSQIWAPALYCGTTCRAHPTGPVCAGAYQDQRSGTLETIALQRAHFTGLPSMSSWNWHCM